MVDVSTSLNHGDDSNEVVFDPPAKIVIKTVSEVMIDRGMKGRGVKEE